MKHKCSGCGQRKDIYMPLQGGGYCRDCSRATGMSAPRNNAAKNSDAWKKQPCKHQAVSYSYERVRGKKYHVSHCRRCKVEVTRVLV
jgi:hypothetical protein